MLRKPFRLKSRALFKRALGGQRLCSTDCFVIYGLTPAPHLPVSPYTPKFGLIVSKKIDKRASRRNRIKRRLREMIRQKLLTEHYETVKKYRAIVIIARSRSLEASYLEMQEKLLRCFR